MTQEELFAIVGVGILTYLSTMIATRSTDVIKGLHSIIAVVGIFTMIFLIVRALVW